MRTSVRVLAVVMLTGFGVTALADDVDLETVPPVIVKTIPQAGSQGVDPKLSEIKVTFSKEMLDNSWSWVKYSEESFPQLTGKPRFLEDNKTCVLPVKLESGKTYALWINTSELGNFKDLDGRPALPYLLVFKTK